MNIYREILSALETEDSIMLATIVSTSGSTPASLLSKMIIKNGGRTSVGTIGGGCMEGDVLAVAKELYGSQKSRILTFHLTEEEFIQGLICGGTLDILLEPITRKQVPLIQEIITACDGGTDCVLVTSLNTDGTVLKKSIFSSVDMFSEKLNASSVEIKDTAQQALRRNVIQRIQRKEGETIIEPVQSTPTLLLFGGGHISKWICEYASTIGFQVTVFDDRKKFSNPERFPTAAHSMHIDFLEAFHAVSISHSTYIIIVTRGHRYDEEILERALQTPACYIGMIGSKRKVETTFQRLLEHGTTIEQLRRVQAPMGLELGAVTPEEIAVSVISQLIRIRRKTALPVNNKSEVMYSFFAKFNVPS